MYFSHLGYSLKKRARGAVGSAVGAGEVGGGKEEDGRETKEHRNWVREVFLQITYKIRYFPVKGLSSSAFCCARRFLIRQYRAQLKRRAQQVQEELVPTCSISL